MLMLTANTHPVPTAPAVTGTPQNKASSGSSVSGTAVGPDRNKDTNTATSSSA